MTKKVHLGLDLGVSSVGWSLVDSDQNIIAAGSHLFSQLSDPKTGKYGEGIKGEIRRSRRIWNRKKQRKIDFLNMIDLFNDNQQAKLKKINKLSRLYKKEYQQIFGFSKDNSSTDFLFNEAKKYDIYKIWKQGLEKEIKPKELFLFLYFKLSLRGVFFKSFEFDDSKKYTYNDSLLKIIYNDIYFKKNKKYRDKSNGDLTYSIFHNWKDIETVLNNCKYITKEFIEDYKKIFLRHRKFSKGPGNWKLKNNQSIWGIQYDSKKSFEDMEQINLWDTKINFCPISLAKNKGDEFKTEKRLNNYFWLPELANIISQLVFVKIEKSVNDNTTLSKSEIIKIINNSLNHSENITANRIKKFLDNTEISKFPVDKQGNSNFEKMIKLSNYFKEQIIKHKDRDHINIENSWEIINYIDSVRFKMISTYFESSNLKSEENNQNNNYSQSINDAKKYFEIINNPYINIDFEKLVNFKDVNNDDISGTRGFGLSAYEEYLQYFFNLDSNATKIKSFSLYFKDEIRKGQELSFNFKNNSSKYLPESMFAKQEFISINAKNTLKESIRIINRILKQYIYKQNLNLESIIIETTWDSDNIEKSLISNQKKEEIKKYQSYNEEQNKQAIQRLEENKIELTNEMIKKMRLWLEQDGKDIYTGKSILINQLQDCQIDHLIPESISFNSNWENLGLTLENSKKSNLLASEHINNNDKNIINWWTQQYNTEIKSKKNKNQSIQNQIKNKKFKNLIIKRDEILDQNFINSNLFETTYAIRKLKNGLIFFFKNFNDNYKFKESKEFNLIKNCDIRTINGRQSQTLRKDFFNLPKKDRSISDHHAHDASIIAMFSSFNHINNFYNKIKEEGSKQYILDRYYENEKRSISIKKLSNIIHNTEILKNKIINSKCIYSFKKTTILPKDFYKKETNEEKWNEIIKIKPKQIFSSQVVTSFIKIENKKYEKQYLKLNTLKHPQSDSINKNLLILFKDIRNEIKKEKNLKEIKEKINLYKEKGNVFAKKIESNWFIIYSLYKCVENYIDDIELKQKKNEFVFKRYLNDLVDKNILNNLKENINGHFIQIDKSDKEYVRKIMDEYIPIINEVNGTFKKISKLKIVNKDQYFPVMEIDKERKIEKISNKFIFNLDKLKHLSKNASWYGNETKLYVLLKYKNNSKIKIDFFKINWMNQIVNKPENIIEIITYVDPNKWYLLSDGNIYRISNYDKSSCKLYIQCKSNINIKEVRKTFNAWSGFQDEIQKEIFEIIICQNLKMKT